jgi:hypothetical protein
MDLKDYKAILSAVEQAITVCDKYAGAMDDARRKICEDLHRVRRELRQLLGLPMPDSP